MSTSAQRWRKWREAHPEAAKQVRSKQKIEALRHYSGGDPICAECGITDIRVLEIDHINGGGNAHRREIGPTNAAHFYWWLKSQGYPAGYRVLCRNCNWIARLEVKERMNEKAEGQSFTPEEVAERLNCHVATVQELLRKGRLKGFKLNRQWRVTPEELQRFQTQEASN